MYRQGIHTNMYKGGKDINLPLRRAVGQRRRKQGKQTENEAGKGDTENQQNILTLIKAATLWIFLAPNS